MKKEKYFATSIIHWYRNNGRTYPWRETNNPFYVLISEIMLQKTDSKKVLLIYPSFIKKYPTPKQLSRANFHTLQREIHLLGIRDRARRMKENAKSIISFHDGKVPSDKTQLLNLLGVGDYIANAVLCFAFGKDLPILDTNVIRVIKRVFSVESSKKRARTDRMLWEFASCLVPKSKAIEYNRGILDFAAIVCTVRNPNCPICPLTNICDFYLRTKLLRTS